MRKMTLWTLAAAGCVLWLGLAAGCGEDNRGRGGGGGGGGEGEGEGEGEGQGEGEGEGEGGGEGEGEGQCDETDPEGLSCQDSDDCTVACECENGSVQTGGCGSGGCESASSACTAGCEFMGSGEFTGNFCFIGNSGGSEGEGEGEGGGEGEGEGEGGTAGYGESCDDHADCEGFSGDVFDSEVHCISYCGEKFCSNDCDSDIDCSGFSTCDTHINACIPDEHECGDEW